MAEQLAIDLGPTLQEMLSDPNISEHTYKTYKELIDGFPDEDLRNTMYEFLEATYKEAMDNRNG